MRLKLIWRDRGRWPDDMAHKILFATDLHGSEPLYKELFELAKKDAARSVVLGGDLFPITAEWSRIEEDQQEFIKDYFLPWLENFSRFRPLTDVYVLLGNDDLLKTKDTRLLDAVDGKILKMLHNKVYKLDGTKPKIFLAGYETGRASYQKTFYEETAALAELSDPERTIYVFHMPPFNTALSATYSGHGQGADVRHFITRSQPLLTLHGHAHFAPYATHERRWYDFIGETLCINPGQTFTPRFSENREYKSSWQAALEVEVVRKLHAVTFDAGDPMNTIRHNVFGKLRLR